MLVSFQTVGLWESPRIAKWNRVHLLWVGRSFVVRMARSDLRFHFMGAQITIGGIGIGCPADLGVKSKAHFKWTTGHATSINFWSIKGDLQNSITLIRILLCLICIIDQNFISDNQVRGPTSSLKTKSFPSWTLTGLVFSESGAC